MANRTEDTFGKTLKCLPGNRVVRLANVTCVYCGTLLTEHTTSREHVIGKRFVPKGKLHGCWNLIVNACRTCNGIKSDLEDDISAITMQPDIFGRYGHDDEVAVLDGHRKAIASRSRRTRKHVKDSREEVTIEGGFAPGVGFSFKFTAPPQADRDRIYKLARLQIIGFFYWITFRVDESRGRYWRGGFLPCE